MVGWLVNIKFRWYAMWIFTVSTVLSIFYFAITSQIPFFTRSVVYLGIDIATLWHINKERHLTQRAADAPTVCAHAVVEPTIDGWGHCYVCGKSVRR